MLENKVNKDLKNLRKCYNRFSKQNNYDLNTCLSLGNEFMEFVIQKVLEGEEVRLPARLGSLSVIGRKIKPKIDSNGNIRGLSPDWVKTKQLWESDPQSKKEKKLVYHLNEHTNGVRYKFHWNKKYANMKNKSLYTLVMTRTNKRKLHSLIKAGKEYIVIN